MVAQIVLVVMTRLCSTASSKAEDRCRKRCSASFAWSREAAMTTILVSEPLGVTPSEKALSSGPEYPKGQVSANGEAVGEPTTASKRCWGSP